MTSRCRDFQTLTIKRSGGALRKVTSRRPFRVDSKNFGVRLDIIQKTFSWENKKKNGHT